MKLIDRFFCLLMDLFMMLSKCLLVIMTLIICLSVFYRRVLNTGLSWTDEVAMLFMVWFGFISMAYGVQRKLHISVNVFYGMMPPKLQIFWNKFINTLVCVIGIVLFVYGIRLMSTTMTNLMTSTRWPTAIRYAPVAIAGLLMSYFSFADLIGFKSGGFKEDKESEVVDNEVIEGEQHAD